MAKSYIRAVPDYDDWRATGDSAQKYMLEELYRPPEEIRNFTFDVLDKLIKWRSLRDMPYRQFNSQPFIVYLREARQKFWGYLPLSYEAEVPQFFFPETRNQINAILAKIANLKMKPRFDGVEGFDLVKARLLKDLFEYWRRGKNRNMASFWQYLYNIVNGTIITFVAYQNGERKVRNVTSYDAQTGETKYDEQDLHDSDVDEVICNLEDIFIPKIWEPDMQRQGECIWRTLMKWRDFKEEFKSYENVQYVMPGAMFADPSIFREFLSYDVRGSEFVEVVRYFDAQRDRYAIIANGVLLNPCITNGKQHVAPLPWNHKKLPFAKTVFEPIDPTFFYGMPLAQKVKSPQDALNKMWELMLAREQRSVASPILTNDPSVELGLEFKAGRIYQVQADPIAGYRELSMSPSSASYWNALTSLQGIIQRTGSGGVGQVTPTQQPRSATEFAVVQDQMKEQSGLYTMFYQDLLEQRTYLALTNIIQFYTASKTKQVLGTRQFEKVIALTDMEMIAGGRGNREIRITSQPASAKDLQKESWVRSLLTKEKVEIIEVSPEAMRKIRFDIKITFEMERTPESERALYLDYIATMVKLFGPTGLLSFKKMIGRVAEKFGENLSDIAEDKVVEDYMRGATGMPGEAKPSEMPGVNAFNQSLRGMANGAAGGTQNVMGGGGLPTQGPGGAIADAEAIVQNFGR